MFHNLKTRLHGQDISYQIEGPSDLTLSGDQVQFSQVFYNLVLNAMQAIGAHGHIDDRIIQRAEQLILHALTYNFASMDVMIAATAQETAAAGRNIIVVTSDKSLKACLSKANISCWDAFQAGPGVVS